MTREKILSAVVKTYKDKGLEGLTIKSVAEIAGIGKSTVYEYFDNKEQMLADSIMYSADLFVEDFYNKEWNQHDLGFEQTLKSSIEYMIDSLKKEFGDFLAFAMESSNGRFKQYIKEEKQKDLMILMQKAIEYTNVLFELGQSEGVIREGLSTLDVVNFQRILFLLCSNFAEKAPLVTLLSKDIEEPIDYIYDHIVRLYG